MKIDISHTRNNLMGWDIKVKAIADKSERIASVRIAVNGFDQSDKQLDPPANQYQTELSRVGQFPGDNETRVTVTDEQLKEIQRG